MCFTARCGEVCQVSPGDGAVPAAFEATSSGTDRQGPACTRQHRGRACPCSVPSLCGGRSLHAAAASAVGQGGTCGAGEPGPEGN